MRVTRDEEAENQQLLGSPLATHHFVTNLFQAYVRHALAIKV